MNLKEKVYQVIMNELNIKEGDTFIIQYRTEGSRKELECVFKKGELKNASTYDNLSGKMLAVLLAKDTTIQKKPWKPKMGEIFYFYNPKVEIIQGTSFLGVFDVGMYMMGNCFKSADDITDEDKEKITKEFNMFLG